MHRFLFLAAFFSATSSQPSTTPCVVPDTGLGVSFDLTDLASNGVTFTAKDNRQEGADPWSYQVSVCNNAPVPAGCEKSVNDDGSVDPNAGNNGPAFQYCNGPNCPAGTGQFCRRLGEDQYCPNPPCMSLQLLFNDPSSQREARLYARGLMINYTNGNNCWSPQQQQYVPRKVSLILECYDGPSFNPPAALVAEDVSCEYFVVMKTRYGCPSQCMAKLGDSPCSQKGICGYDATNQKARCFCNEEWFGPYCEQPGISTGPPLSTWAGNIIGGFIGGAIVGALGVLGYNAYTARRAGAEWAPALKEGLRLERLFAPRAPTGTPYSYVQSSSLQGGSVTTAAFANDVGEEYKPPEAL